ncbi:MULTISPECIES: hypothetical protein [unclassified Dinoroseobacter]|uniref:hypothetical protein n=1 Tax=unclassified Dinoroseobacter TaxID=2620028 RepID=UPI003C79A3B2
MTKPPANRLRRFLALERQSRPNRNTKAVYRRAKRVPTAMRAYLRIERGIEA